MVSGLSGVVVVDVSARTECCGSAVEGVHCVFARVAVPLQGRVALLMVATPTHPVVFEDEQDLVAIVSPGASM